MDTEVIIKKGNKVIFRESFKEVRWERSRKMVKVQHSDGFSEFMPSGEVGAQSLKVHAVS